MKRKYIVPTFSETMVEVWTTFLDNLSFTIGDNPHGGWSDAKVRENEDEHQDNNWGSLW